MESKTSHRYRPSALLFVTKVQGSRVFWDGMWSKGKREGGGLEERKREKKEKEERERRNTATSEASAGRV